MNVLVSSGDPRKHGRTAIAARFIESIFGFLTLELSVMEIPVYNGEEEQATDSVVKSLRQ